MTRYPLEPDRRAMEEMGQRALALVTDFIDGLPDAPASNVGDVEPRLPEYLLPPTEEPGEFGELLDRFGEAAAVAVETAGPRYMAYVGGGGLFTSALAEMVARALNRYTTLASFAPALVALEESTLRWLCGQFGLPDSAGGVTTTGGSLATLVALVAARHDRLGDDFASGTVYVTAQTHRCLAKAARLAGLPAGAIRTVPTTPDLRMDPEAAAQMITRDRARGLRPFLLVASAGTTSTGAVDPIGELARLARSEGLWNHVDAAYGGFFQLTERGRARFAGIEHADSVVLDPHKGLFLPHGTGILLVRNPAAVRAAHAVDGAYLQDLDADQPLPDYAELGPELHAGLPRPARLVAAPPPRRRRLPSGPRREARSSGLGVPGTERRPRAGAAVGTRPVDRAVPTAGQRVDRRGQPAAAGADPRHQAPLPVEHPYRPAALPAPVHHLAPHAWPGRGGRGGDHPRRRCSGRARSLTAGGQKKPGSM